MRGPRPTLAALSLSVFVVWPAAIPMARAGDEAETLNRAIQLFEQGEYLSAQELLLGIDRNKLNKSQQAQRDDCLNRVQVALIMSEKALRDAEDAETAVAAGEMDRARLLLEGIQANPYAKQEFKQAAAARLRQLPGAPAQPETPVQPREPASPEKPAQPNESAPKKANGPNGTQAPPVSPADAERARVLIQEGQELIKAARYDEAERRFEEALRLVPGHPDAVAGIEQARQHAQIRAGTIGETLIERIRRQDEVNWQRTVTEYREAEGAIRGHVESERFEDANLLLVRARQIVEAGRQFADPITKYESLRGELEALERFVQEKERQYNEDKVAKVRREIEEQRSARLRQIEEDRARQVNALMEQAAQHRKDGNLAAAVEVLKQVIVIDPKYQPARWMMDILEDQRQYRKERDIVLEQRRQTRETLRDVEEAKIPWHEQLKYPKDWLEIISRPERQAPGKARRESRLWSALDAPIPVDFRREPLQQVLERLAEAHRLNLIVNWNDLQRAGVNRETAIDLSLPSEISLKRALTEILDQAGGGDVDLGFDVDDGAVTVATQSFLDKKTYVAMYDINDLLVTLPQFDKPPLTDLRAATRIQSSPRPAAGDAPWRVGDDDDDEPQEDPERLSRVRQLLDLIQDTVAPDSWRERGGSVGSIKEINGSLVITQNSAAQREIGDLLSSLRAERAIQIAVEAVFITVTSHYLEELGMNLNLLFNAGNAGLDFIPGAGGPAVDPVLGNRLLLPRQFSRLGFTPNTPALGTATATDPNIDPVPQPFGQPFLVPRRAGGSGRQLTPVPVRSSILDFTDPTNITSDIPGSFGGQQIGPALSIFGSFLDNIQVDFLIRATQADSRSSVLTAPRVVVFNGFGAWVAVTISQNFISTLNPVVAQQAVAQAPIIGTIDAGAVLVIQQAVVSADKRYVMMILNPGVTRLIDLQSFPFSGGSFALDAFVQLPTLSSLRIQTAVNVPDGGTLLIGGQRLASETEIEAGVPILSKLPILKRAYNARTTVKDEQTLLILIKPKILIQTEQEELAFPSFNR